MALQPAAWFTPRRLLFLFCCMSLLVYVDRGVISSNGVNGAANAGGVPGYGIQGDFGLSLFEDGVLPAAFMVGLLGASLVFAQVREVEIAEEAEAECRLKRQSQKRLRLNGEALGPEARGQTRKRTSNAFFLLFHCFLSTTQQGGAQLISSTKASKVVNGFRLIGIGLSVWTLAVAGSGAALGFWSLVFCRAFVGVGEASFVALASPFIDDNAPPQSKTAWLATFYLCIPVGYALGYIFGGVIAGPLGWRSAFWLEAVAMAPFALFCLLAPPIDIRGPKEAEEAAKSSEGEDGGAGGALHSPMRQLGADLKQLWAHPVYTITVAGTAVYTGSAHLPRIEAVRKCQQFMSWAAAGVIFSADIITAASSANAGVIGAYAYMGPKAGRDVFSLRPETADLTFGAITVLTGVFGTVCGGIALDRMGSSIRNALALCAGAVAAGCLFCGLSFGVAKNLAQFGPLFALGELGLFAIQAPANAIVLWSVPPGLRPLACSLQIVVTHLFGDVPSPPLLGLLQGALKNWRLSMSIFSLALLAASALYLAARSIAAQQPDYRQAAQAGSGSSSLAGGSDGEAEAQSGLLAAEEVERV